VAEVVVLAAASLTELLGPLTAQWSAAAGVSVRASFDASSRLAPQVAAGAPADLFVSADRRWVDWLVERGAGAEADVRLLWTNRMVVVVPRGDEPLVGPEALASLARVALAGEEVPAGRYAERALREAGVWEQLAPAVVRGGSVRGTLEWVARGEVDAAVVYRTDARLDERVETVFELPMGGGEGPAYYGLVPASAPDRARGLELLEHLAASGPLEQVVGEATPGESPVDPVAAIRLSLLVALASVVVGLLPAVALGWLLARRRFPGKSVVSTVFLAPLVLPPVVTGFLLLEFLGRNTAVGGLLEGLGLAVPFTLLGAVIAAVVVGFPLYVVSVRGAFEAVDHRYEELSWTLGVAPRSTFLRVSLPLALPGIAAGALLAFARALGEFGATVVLAGNLEGETRTIALAVYSLLESPAGREATWMLVGASVIVSLLALVGYEHLNRRQRQRILEHHRG